MEPRAQRRKRSSPLVAPFLRDPSSGRVYRRGKLIGKGAFSRCYKLTDMSTNAVFALKVVPRGGAGRLRPRGKVEREIALHSRLRHRNIVAFHGHFSDRDHVYLVLEYCSRQSLAHVLKVRRTLTEPEVRYYLRGLVSGLHYLHQRRIVHRDLKPKMYQNIRAVHYPEPTHLSPSARSLISRLLAPDPAQRPSLDHLLQDDFFTQGFTPDRLPPHSCHSPPVFVFLPPLGGLFQKVGQLLTQCRRLPCPFTPKEASGPEEETGPDHTESVNEEKKTLLYPETHNHLLTHGTLRSSPTVLKGSQGPEVEAAIKKLLLCLDAGPLAAQDTPAEPKPVLWAPKCVDYSSKYGFGYQLSDGGIGVLFRDGSHMALRPPRSHVSYLPERSSLQTFAPRDVPGPLCAKLAILRLFTCYMQGRLREEGAVPMSTVPTEPATPGFCLLSFVADPQVLVLMLSNGAVQVSSRAAQTHLVLSGDGQSLLLTHWESGGSGAATSYSVDILRQHGCVPAIHGHLRHGLRLLQSL